MQWTAPEFAHSERSAGWHLASIAIAGILVIFALFQKNILFALFVIIGELLILFMGRAQPVSYTYELTEEGVKVDDQPRYFFNNLNAYSIIEINAEYVELILRPREKISTFVRLLLPRPLAAKADAFLSHYLRPFDYNEGLGEIIMRRMGL